VKEKLRCVRDRLTAVGEDCPLRRKDFWRREDAKKEVAERKATEKEAVEREGA
jgi:hypothetical protein